MSESFPSYLQSTNINNQNLLALLENSNFERDQAIMNYEQLKMQYQTLKRNYHTVSSDFTLLQDQQSQYANIANYTNHQIKSNQNIIKDLEKKYSTQVSKSERYETENKLLKNQLSHFKSWLEEMEQRKENENKTWATSLLNLKGNYETLKKESCEDKSKISDWQFQINSLKQEKNIARADNDHWTRIIEESNFIVKEAEEKSKGVDNIIKQYKQQIQELSLEIEKHRLRLKWNQDQMNKLNDEYNRVWLDKQEIFDKSLSEIKDKYEEILEEKKDELTLVKGDYISMKMERDKFMAEYNINKNEIDKMMNNVWEEREKDRNYFHEKETIAAKAQTDLEDELGKIKVENEELRKERKKITQELNTYREQAEKRADLNNRIIKNESELTEEVARMKNRIEELEKENKWWNEKMQRGKWRFKQLEESSGMKIKAFEQTFNSIQDVNREAGEKRWKLMQNIENEHGEDTGEKAI